MTDQVIAPDTHYDSDLKDCMSVGTARLNRDIHPGSVILPYGKERNILNSDENIMVAHSKKDYDESSDSEGGGVKLNYNGDVLQGPQEGNKKRRRRKKKGRKNQQPIIPQSTARTNHEPKPTAEPSSPSSLGIGWVQDTDDCMASEQQRRTRTRTRTRKPKRPQAEMLLNERPAIVIDGTAGYKVKEGNGNTCPTST